MADVRLDERQQRALRTLLRATPVPGSPIPTEDVLVAISELVPCDAIGVGLADDHGRILDGVELPHGYAENWQGPDHHGDTPFYVGMMHWAEFPRQAAACHTLDGATDGVAIGFRNGPDCVAQLWLDRTAAYFTEHDLALLTIITPVLQRLLRERPTPALPSSLTPQERRVLMLVAAGMSNPRIAEELFVAPSTVRKHLEHVFRKLGVTSRLAAVAALQGRDHPDLDLRERLARLG
jgi:DNA-binding CsgD family transcriptional regulator